MRLLLGMVLGALLIVGVAFVADSQNTGPTTTTGSATASERHRPMVNWDVVGDNLRIMRDRARETWNQVSHKIAS